MREKRGLFLAGVVGVALGAVGAALLIFNGVRCEYVAEAMLVPSCPDDGSGRNAGASVRVQQAVARLEAVMGDVSSLDFCQRVVRRACSGLGGRPTDEAVRECAATLTVIKGSEVGTFRVHAAAPTAQEASRIANEYAVAISRHLDDALRTSREKGVEQLAKTAGRLKRRLESLERRMGGAAVVADGDLAREHREVSNAWARVAADALAMKSMPSPSADESSFKVGRCASPADAVESVVLFGKWRFRCP